MKRWLWVGCLAGMLAGCGDEPLTVEELVGEAADVFESDWFGGEEEYGASQSTEALRVPPQLSLPDTSKQLIIPEFGGVSAKKTGRGQVAVLPGFLDMKVRREGNVRWLEVGADPVTLWPHLRAFWEDQGFELAQEAPLVGLLETRWREKADDVRALEAEGGSPYYAASREKFRLRMEREPNAYANVFITRQKLEVAGVDTGNTVVWKPGRPNPEREAEMLVRLMEYLGASRVEGVATLEEEEVEDTVGLDLQYIGGIPVLMVEDEYSSVWRQVGVALERSGLYVVDFDRSQGTYVFRYRGGDSADGKGVLLEVHLLAREKDLTLLTVHRHKSKQPVRKELTRSVLRAILAAYALVPRATADAQ